jgi:type II secretory pathway component GspD/PulD (secretin)
MLMHVRRHLLTVLTLLAALSVSLPLGAADPTTGRPGAKPAAGDPKKKDQPATPPELLKVKAFQLKRTNPEEVRQTLIQLWPHLNGKGEDGPSRPGTAVAGAQPMPRIAVSPRTRTLFVRAGKTALETAGELVEVLDGDSDRVGENLKNLAIIRLRHAQVHEVLQVLQPLGLQGTFVALPQMKAIVVLKAGDSAKEIEEVISQADQPTPSERTTRGEGVKPKR